MSEAKSGLLAAWAYLKVRDVVQNKGEHPPLEGMSVGKRFDVFRENALKFLPLNCMVVLGCGI